MERVYEGFNEENRQDQPGLTGLNRIVLPLCFQSCLIRSNPVDPVYYIEGVAILISPLAGRTGISIAI